MARRGESTEATGEGLTDDPRVDALYGLPLDRFVAERNALAKALRSEGERTAADAVRGLAKPSRAAWAVNQAVRAQPAEADRLADAARLLGDAQRELLAGGDASALRSAGERARSAIEALVAAAPDAGPGVADKVRATLHAATIDSAVLAEVTAGRLVEDRVASGFGGLAPPVGGGPARRPNARTRDARSDDAARRAREAERRSEKLRRAKEEEAAAESALAAATSALEQVESLLAARRRDVREAQTVLRDARRRRERAEE